MHARLLIAVLVVVATALPRGAAAHGGASIDKDPCVQKTGNWAVHFTVYEPQFNPADEYCADVPKAGNMIVVFDLVDQELRKVPLDLEIVKLAGSTRESVQRVSTRSYPNGVINAELQVAAPGRYAAILTPAGSPAIVFPIRVELGTPVWVWLVPLVLVAPALYYWSQRRTPPPSRSLALVK
ncbi:MAG TPA: hypothetical protein VMR29_02885 [Candidatus Binatia bacterium]|nr:hypothetical protein [Candidatus Binatia bacterium]